MFEKSYCFHRNIFFICALESDCLPREYNENWTMENVFVFTHFYDDSLQDSLSFLGFFFGLILSMLVLIQPNLF